MVFLINLIGIVLLFYGLNIPRTSLKFIQLIPQTFGKNRFLLFFPVINWFFKIKNKTCRPLNTMR